MHSERSKTKSVLADFIPTVALLGRCAARYGRLFDYFLLDISFSFFLVMPVTEPGILLGII